MSATIRTKVRFEIQEREDLAHLSVEGYVDYVTGDDPWDQTIENIEVEDHDKFTKLVLTAFLHDERHFDCIFLEGRSEKLPGLIQVWPTHLLKYFGVPDIGE